MSENKTMCLNDFLNQPFFFFITSKSNRFQRRIKQEDFVKKLLLKIEPESHARNKSDQKKKIQTKSSSELFFFIGTKVKYAN